MALHSRPPVAVSMGDPAGIGPDIILKAFGQSELPSFFVTGSRELLAKRAKSLGLDISITDFQEGKTGTLQVLDVVASSKDLSGEPGTPSLGDAHLTIAAIDRAVACVFDGTASAMTTAPINKAVLYDAGFAQPGHTEYLGELAQRRTGRSVLPVMMLAGPNLKTVPVTIHVPLKDIFGILTTELIVQTAQIVNEDMKMRFGIGKPRLAVSGLNPHAGEAGALGLEDDAIIEPAVSQLRQDGIDAIGPLPADTMFHTVARKQYDVALCMYHDQALIPAKALAFDQAVNITLGLPFVRTSPDHGTAYDIAGTGKADPSSFMAALRLADQMGNRH